MLDSERERNVATIYEFSGKISAGPSLFSFDSESDMKFAIRK